MIRIFLGLVIILLPVMKSTAQQNFFNVPSAELTEKKHIFFQQQFNLNAIDESNTTITVGLSKRFEAGINIFSVQIPTDSATDHTWYKKTDILCNMQYRVYSGHKCTVTVGMQSGIKYLKVNRSDYATYNYVNYRREFKNGKIKCVGGIYYANNTYGGKGNNIGIQAGADMKLLPRLNFTSDWIIGDNSISVWVGGLTWYIKPKIVFSSGLQLPSPGSYNTRGIVFEFTLL